MYAYEIHEVDGLANSGTLNAFNALDPQFPPLTRHHYTNGYWWLAYLKDEPVAFAGMVPMVPFPGVGYLKRCYVRHRGHGIQFRMMVARELKARQLGWSMLVSECAGDNTHSANNFMRAGYERFTPEQCWGVPGSIYWIKRL